MQSDQFLELEQRAYKDWTVDKRLHDNIKWTLRSVHLINIQTENDLWPENSSKFREIWKMMLKKFKKKKKFQENMQDRLCFKNAYDEFAFHMCICSHQIFGLFGLNCLLALNIGSNLNFSTASLHKNWSHAQRILVTYS